MARTILLLGGTIEARRLAERLAPRADLAVTLSLAGRTANPIAQAVPVRSGGFGGVEGLVRYLRAHGVQAVIDATHPYAAQMSAHAAAAARETGLPLLRLERPAWRPVAGDAWQEVPDVESAVAALGEAPRRVFVTLGRQEVGPFGRAPQHHYVIRSVDPIQPPLPLPQVRYLLDRGPFPEAAEWALLLEHGIEVIVAKNSGGDATYGKIAAARALNIPVVMLARPALPPAESVGTIGAALRWIDHQATPGSTRGV